ncbi:MAG: PQQ-binding-like beta-propeller repeat protein [Armatimonadetes bacterium]|nr:PQQ-binding-like beta-propeller repeat protein [Armatimonadota bacterium]
MSRRILSDLVLYGLFGFIPVRAVAMPLQSYTWLHINSSSKSSSPIDKLPASLVAHTVQPAFVIDTGNLTESEQEQDASRFNQGAKTPVPLYVTPGNLDLRWSEKGKKGYVQRFGPLYRSFDYGGSHFVLLDSTILLQHGGHFDVDELKWLQKDLKKQPRGEPIFLFFHNTLGGNREIIDNSQELIDTIAPFNIVAIFVGSENQSRHWRTNGISCFATGPLHDGTYTIVQMTPDDAKVEWADENGNLVRTIVTLPLKFHPRTIVGFSWLDPDISILARRQFQVGLFGGRHPLDNSKIKAEYRIDGGKWVEIKRDDRGNFTAEFMTAGLFYGAHILTTRLTVQKGGIYTDYRVFLFEHVPPPPSPIIQWGFHADDSIQSGPVLGDDLVYFGSLDGKIYAVVTNNGKHRWTFKTKGPVYAPPALYGGSLYIGSTDHFLYAFDATNGHLLWKFDTGSPVYAGAALSNGVICIGSSQAVYGLDVKTGKQLWKRTVNTDFQSASAADNSAFYLTGKNNDLYALDAASGAIRWKVDMGKLGDQAGLPPRDFSPTMSRPVVANGRIYVCTDRGALIAVAAANGHIDWSAHPPSVSGGGYTSPVVVGDQAVVGSYGGAGAVYSFNLADGRPLWHCSTGPQNIESAPAYEKGTIISCSVGGTITCINAATGKLEWTYHQPPGYCFGSPAYDGIWVYQGSMDGYLFAIGLNRPPTKKR